VFIVAAFTGLRLSELRGLRWADVDCAKRTIHVRRNIPQHGVKRVPKSGKVRSVPLVDRAAEVLDDLSRRGDWTGDADLAGCEQRLLDDREEAMAYPGAEGSLCTNDSLRGGRSRSCSCACKEQRARSGHGVARTKRCAPAR
jgi:hypothetical protein